MRYCAYFIDSLYFLWNIRAFENSMGDFDVSEFKMCFNFCLVLNLHGI